MSVRDETLAAIGASSVRDHDSFDRGAELRFHEKAGSSTGSRYGDHLVAAALRPLAIG